MPVAKVLVSMDEELLARVDRAARALGLTRSAYLSRVAARYLGVARGPGRTPAARRAAAELERLFASNPVTGGATEAVRAERDAR